MRVWCGPSKGIFWLFKPVTVFWKLTHTHTHTHSRTHDVYKSTDDLSRSVDHNQTSGNQPRTTCQGEQIKDLTSLGQELAKGSWGSLQLSLVIIDISDYKSTTLSKGLWMIIMHDKQLNEYILIMND